MTNFLLKKAGLAFDEGKTRLALKKSTLALLIVIETKTKSAKAKRKKASAGLQSGMDHQASMDVEQLIRQDFEIQAYDAIKVQCNQLADRLRVLGSEKECPPGTKQAVCTLIWAAGKAEVPEELQVVKVQLTKKYGKDFATKALNNDDSCVNTLVAEKLLFQADPAPQLVEEYLETIRKESDVPIVQKATAPLPRVARPPAPAVPAPASTASAVLAPAVPAPASTASATKAATAPAKPVAISTEAPEESPTKNASKPLTKASMESPVENNPSEKPRGSSVEHPKETPEEETPKRMNSTESPEDETPKTAPTTSPSSSATSPIVAKPPTTSESFKLLPVSIRRAANAAAGSVRPIIPA